MKQLFVSVNSSGIEVVGKFRDLINRECKNYDQIVVRLTETGIRYFENNTYHSFIDLIEENIGKNIIYFGSNYSNTSKKLPLHFINYMFHCGPTLYKTDTACMTLLEHCIIGIALI